MSKSVALSAGTSLLGAAAGAASKRQYYEIQIFQMKTGSQVQRSNDFFAQVYLPAVKKLGLPPLGFFNPVIGQQSPFLLMIVSHPSLDSVEALQQKLDGNQEYRKGLETYLAGDPPYMRRERSLLQAFASIPEMEVPAAAKQPRTFEMRTYESNTSLTLSRKIKMFDQGEIAIFRRLGMTPVFFGQTIFGRNIPNLTYMLAFDDLAQREKLWNDFGADAEWQKMRSAPGNSDAELVSNISNMILRPTPYSQVR